MLSPSQCAAGSIRYTYTRSRGRSIVRSIYFFLGHCFRAFNEELLQGKGTTSRIRRARSTSRPYAHARTLEFGPCSQSKTCICSKKALKANEAKRNDRELAIAIGASNKKNKKKEAKRCMVPATSARSQPYAWPALAAAPPAVRNPSKKKTNKLKDERKLEEPLAAGSGQAMAPAPEQATTTCTGSSDISNCKQPGPITKHESASAQAQRGPAAATAAGNLSKKKIRERARLAKRVRMRELTRALKLALKELEHT